MEILNYSGKSIEIENDIDILLNFNLQKKVVIKKIPNEKKKIKNEIPRLIAPQIKGNEGGYKNATMHERDRDNDIDMERIERLHRRKYDDDDDEDDDDEDDDGDNIMSDDDDYPRSSSNQNGQTRFQPIRHVTNQAVENERIREDGVNLIPIDNKSNTKIKADSRGVIGFERISSIPIFKESNCDCDSDSCDEDELDNQEKSKGIEPLRDLIGRLEILVSNKKKCQEIQTIKSKLPEQLRYLIEENITVDNIIDDNNDEYNILNEKIENNKQKNALINFDDPIENKKKLDLAKNAQKIRELKHKNSWCYACDMGTINEGPIYANILNRMNDIILQNFAFTDTSSLSKTLHRFYMANIYFPMRQTGYYIDAWRTRDIKLHLTDHLTDPVISFVTSIRETNKLSNYIRDKELLKVEEFINGEKKESIDQIALKNWISLKKLNLEYYKTKVSGMNFYNKGPVNIDQGGKGFNLQREFITTTNREK